MRSGAACCEPGGTIVEATAGNTGVGLALIGVNRGYKVMLYVPEQFAEEKCKLMRGLGATVVRTPEAEGMAGAIQRALQFERETPGAFAALQFENPANPDFHEQTTAVEIWEQMEGRVDAWVSGVGSAGTFTGVARFLKKKRSGDFDGCGGAAGKRARGWRAGAASGGGDWRVVYSCDV